MTRSGPSFSATSNAAKSPSATTAVPATHTLRPRTQLPALPLLRPDPDERGRLSQILDNLQARIAEAETHRWFGEAEGLKVSLAGARSKLAQMAQIYARPNTAANLAYPVSPRSPAAPSAPTSPEHTTTNAIDSISDPPATE